MLIFVGLIVFHFSGRSKDSKYDNDISDSQATLDPSSRSVSMISRPKSPQIGHDSLTIAAVHSPRAYSGNYTSQQPVFHPDNHEQLRQDVYYPKFESTQESEVPFDPTVDTLPRKIQEDNVAVETENQDQSLELQEHQQKQFYYDPLAQPIPLPMNYPVYHEATYQQPYLVTNIPYYAQMPTENDPYMIDGADQNINTSPQMTDEGVVGVVSEPPSHITSPNQMYYDPVSNTYYMLQPALD